VFRAVGLAVFGIEDLIGNQPNLELTAASGQAADKGFIRLLLVIMQNNPVVFTNTA
jgi:hypothetical protein